MKIVGERYIQSKVLEIKEENILKRKRDLKKDKDIVQNSVGRPGNIEEFGQRAEEDS